MVVLLVADHVDHPVDLVLVEARQRGAEILGHVDGRSIAAQQHLLALQA